MPVISFFNPFLPPRGLSLLRSLGGCWPQRLLIAALVLILGSPADAAKKYTLYQCGSQTNLDNCTKTCVQMDRYEPITIEFTPNCFAIESLIACFSASVNFCASHVTGADLRQVPLGNNQSR